MKLMPMAYKLNLVERLTDLMLYGVLKEAH